MCPTQTFATQTFYRALATRRPLLKSQVETVSRGVVGVGVTWKPSEGQAEVSRLPGSGGSVRLHFEMRLAELYTLEFRCA